MVWHKTILGCILCLCISACAETQDMSKKEVSEGRLTNIKVGGPGPDDPGPLPVKCDHQFLPSKQEQLCQRLLCVEKEVLGLEVDVLIPDFEFSELMFARLPETRDPNTFGLICRKTKHAVGKFRLEQTVLSDRVERSLSTKHTKFLANGKLSKLSGVANKDKNHGYRGSLKGEVSFTLLAPLLQAE